MEFFVAVSCMIHYLLQMYTRRSSTVAGTGRKPASISRSRLKPVAAAKTSDGLLTAPVDPNSFRVVDTELHVEAEQSYLAVSVVHHALPLYCAAVLLCSIKNLSATLFKPFID